MRSVSTNTVTNAAPIGFTPSISSFHSFPWVRADYRLLCKKQRTRRLKKQAEPAFTSAEVRHVSKSCSRGRCYAISHTLKKRAESAFTSAEVCHASKSCSRGRFYSISYTLKGTSGLFPAHSPSIKRAELSIAKWGFCSFCFTAYSVSDAPFHFAEAPFSYTI